MVKKEAKYKANKVKKATKRITKKSPLVTQLTNPRIQSNKQETSDIILNNQNNLNATNTKSSSLTRRLLVIIAILAAFIALISLSNYSGNVTANTEKFLFAKTGNLVLPYNVIDIKKNPNSALLISYKSDLNTNIFAEINDCDDWKNGKDKNKYVLYAVSNVKDANFKLGNILQNTRQQIDFYKASDLCLIFIDKEAPKIGEYKITVKETDKNIYNIIE